MAHASSLVMLPARHTAQAAHSPKAQKPASTTAFAPKLAQAAKLSTAAKQPVSKPAVATTAVKIATPKPPATKPVVSKVEEEETEKESASTGEHGEQKPAPEDENTAEAAAAKIPVPTSATGTALAQSALPTEKKLVKPVKTVGVKSQTASPSGANNLVNAAAKPVDPSANAADDDGDSDSNPVIGNGFYGSTKVVARGGSSGSDEQAAAADAESSDGGASVSAAENTAEAAAGSVNPQASPAAEIAGAVASFKPVDSSGGPANTATMLNALTVQGAGPSAATGKAAVATTAGTSQTEFVQQNHSAIVSSIQGQLMPKGGTMSIRLDPAELGAMQVTVHMKDGVMTASFETSNDNATKLLSRSLGQLKSGLEAAGMSVEKLQVEQSPAKHFQQNTDGESKQPPQEQQQQAQQDQQRRELMQRMLRKIAGGGDPLDLVA